MKMITKFFGILICFYSINPLSAHASETFSDCRSRKGETFDEAKARLTQQVLLSGLRYAREHSHPITGFVADTVENYREQPVREPVRASISSTGFMMALVANLYSKAMVSREEALEYCDRPLNA